MIGTCDKQQSPAVRCTQRYATAHYRQPVRYCTLGAFASERQMRKLPLSPEETFQKMLTMMTVVVVNMMMMVMVIMMLIISIMGRSPATSLIICLPPRNLWLCAACCPERCGRQKTDDDSGNGGGEYDAGDHDGDGGGGKSFCRPFPPKRACKRCNTVSLDVLERWW